MKRRIQQLHLDLAAERFMDAARANMEFSVCLAWDEEWAMQALRRAHEHEKRAYWHLGKADRSLEGVR